MKYLELKSVQIKKYSNQSFFKDAHLVPFSKMDVIKYINTHPDVKITNIYINIYIIIIITIINFI